MSASLSVAAEDDVPDESRARRLDTRMYNDEGALRFGERDGIECRRSGMIGRHCGVLESKSLRVVIQEFCT